MNIVEKDGSKFKMKHKLLTPNQWANLESELNDPTIPKELCCDN